VALAAALVVVIAIMSVSVAFSYSTVRDVTFTVTGKYIKPEDQQGARYFVRGWVEDPVTGTRMETLEITDAPYQRVFDVTGRYDSFTVGEEYIVTVNGGRWAWGLFNEPRNPLHIYPVSG
jgi:hypothetical protein